MYYINTYLVKFFVIHLSVKPMEDQEKPAMDGKDVAQQNHPDSLPPSPPQVAKPEDPAPQKPATAQQLDEVEEKMSAFERSTLKWARVAVIVSGLAFVVVCAQWLEMHKSGTDTHDLAVAAESQATWTKRLANNAGNQLQEMQAEQRPWIYADIRPDGAIYRTQSGGFGFPVAFVLQNTGRLPAQSAMPYLDAHTSRWFYDHHETLAQAQQESCLKGIAKFRTDKEPVGATVFPNHPQAFGEAASISQSDWEKGSLPSKSGGFGAVVEVAGCVVYSYGNQIGTTGFAFSFAWNKGKQPPFNTFALPSDPTTVPADQIVVSAWPVATVWQAK